MVMVIVIVVVVVVVAVLLMMTSCTWFSLSYTILVTYSFTRLLDAICHICAVHVTSNVA